jgi:hypothetical protein
MEGIAVADTGEHDGMARGLARGKGPAGYEDARHASRIAG